MTLAAPRRLIAGLAGTRLGGDERALFEACPPAGFILFARNCESPGQVATLVADLKALFPARWVPVLIDQEGGRVQRLRPPHWAQLPAPGAIACLPAATAARAMRLHAGLLARQLLPLGIDVNCAPVLDVARAVTTAAIGDRALGHDPDGVAALGRIVIDTFRAAGIVPVIKHLPGHGLARVDSHHHLPVIDAPLAELERVDFAPFRACRDVPVAMSAHVLIPELDPKWPATQSRRIIETVIRGTIGFEGLLLSDDLSMNALEGDIETRTMRALDAGCDIGLHCNGDIGEMRRILPRCPELDERQRVMLEAAKPAPAAIADLEDDDGAMLAELASLAGQGSARG